MSPPSRKPVAAGSNVVRMHPSNPSSGSRGRILLAEDDPTAINFAVMVLEDMGGYQVHAVTDPREALELIEHSGWDALITDLRLPYMSGIEVLRAARSRRPDLPVLVLTGDGDMTDAVEALRLQASDFMVKPVSPAVLLERVGAVLAAQAARRPREMVLAIGAHPDDIEIGVGGTLLGHRDRGDDVALLIMTGGERGGLRGGRAAEAAAAAELLGAQLFMERLEDTRIPESGQSVTIIEDVIAQLGATRIYTHSADDRHQDHRNTHRAVMVAAREVPRIFCYQSPSCTIDYRPTRFEAIDSYLPDKLRLIGCHASQAAMRGYLEEDLIVSTARYWGRYGGSRYAEPFDVSRDVQGLVKADLADGLEAEMAAELAIEANNNVG